MVDYLYTIFFIDFFLLVWVVYLYMKSLDKIINIATAAGKIDELRTVSGKPTRLSLMSDFRFAISLFTKSYKKYVSDSELLGELGRASKYLVIQYPLAIIAFLMPIVSKILSQ